jgi:hypothetical protein
MDANVLKLAGIAEKRPGSRFTKQIPAVVPMLFGVEKKRITEGPGVSRFSIKRYGGLAAGGNREAIFEDRVYRQCKTARMFARLHGIEPVFLPAFARSESGRTPVETGKIRSSKRRVSRFFRYVQRRYRLVHFQNRNGVPVPH